MQSPETEISRIDFFAWDERRNFAIDGNCLSTRLNAIPSNTGMFQREPAVARTTLGEYISTESGDVITADIPIASAVRRIVPALPGS